MCQSSVWALYPDGQKEKIIENASYVRQEGADVIVGSFMTKPERLTGSIIEIDAIAHTITVRVARPLEVALKTKQARAPGE
jgi:hypothetical protein